MTDRETEITDDIERVGTELGKGDKAPTFREYMREGKFSRYEIEGAFGSYNNAVEAAGLIPNDNIKPPRSVLVELYYDDLLDTPEIADKYGVETPTVAGWLTSYDIPKIRSTGVRKVLLEGAVKIGTVTNINRETRRRYGIVEEGGAYVYNPAFAHKTVDVGAIRGNSNQE